jgi:uncharacterized cupredoxin-like copper-binding protein
MQKIVLVSFVALIMVLTTACGSPATATQAPVPPAATQAPASAGSSTEVDVTLADNTIDSSLTTFQAGVAYTFVIKNTGRHAHNFNINPPVSIAGSLDAALSSALLAVPQEQLGVGATATVQYTFPDTAAGQELEFSCLIRKHYEDGMKLSITVTK